MTRELTTKDELQDMIQSAIEKSTDLDGDCRDVIANEVYWHEADQSGCNWDLHSFRGDTSCAGVVNRIVAELRARYMIADE